ncbi:S24/S26 family peptidase [uncultured Parabacteroides sp.]|uniref:S24/S26 family peptidase n=1 Tax=uncultured Parabacteroides sp. TaxID=512312 RepID=UPI0026330569|nr:S24/S26 family peptidase [uncultured Parabacteroides sp.]
MNIKEKNTEILVEEIRRILSEGKCVVMTAKGCSMLPFIRGGRDNVVLESVCEYVKGDILLCRVAPGTYVLHRLMEIRGRYLILMGDGNVRGKEWCLPRDVIARVKAIIHKGQYEDCGCLGFRRKSRLWQKLLPVRRFLLIFIRRF